MKLHDYLRSMVLLSAMLLLQACQPKSEKIIQTLGEEITTYQNQPTTENRIQVESTLSNLDEALKKQAASIEKLSDSQRKEAKDQLSDLQRRRAELLVDFQAAKFNQTVEDTKRAMKAIGETLNTQIKGLGKIFKGDNTTAPSEETKSATQAESAASAETSD